MSRIGKRPIDVPKGVTVSCEGQKVSVKGPKGSLSRVLHASVELKQDASVLKVFPRTTLTEDKCYYGLSRTLVHNMVLGVTEGFTKRLKLVGVGYRAANAGKKVSLSLGFSHPIEFDPPSGIDIKVDQQTTLVVSGADKELVGQVAAKLRSFRPPEPYHGKGVRYEDEKIQTKEGKAAGKK